MKKHIFLNKEERSQFVSLINESNTYRIQIVAPFMILFMGYEIGMKVSGILDSRIYTPKLNIFSTQHPIDYNLFTSIIALLVIVASIAIIVLNFIYKKKPQKLQRMLHHGTQVYCGLLLFFCVITTLTNIAVNHLSDLTYFYFIAIMLTAVFYVHPILVLVELLAANAILWGIPALYSWNPVYSSSKSYGVFILLALCGCAFLRSQYLLQTLRREEKIRKFSEEADRQNHLKTLFLANMSHEIRTPMNAIIGMSELALDFNLEDSEKNTIRQIRSSGLALVNIINDILDFSKIESGKMEIVKVNYDLLKMVYDAANVAKVKLAGKNVELVIEMDPELASLYNGDDLRLRQILINLAGNAAKFTEKGFILIRLENLRKYEERDGLRFSVIDSGIGIKPEDLNKLFNAFQQVDMKMNRAKEGTGLGLSISKKLVQLMGGTLGVESEYGKGSCFYFNLPQEAVSEKTVGQVYQAIFDKAPVNARHPELKNLGLDSLLNQKEFAGLFAEKSEKFNFICPDARILVVDDNDVNLQVATGLLKKFGVVPDTCLSGFDCLTTLEKSDYHIVFLDHQMPGMDGVETLQKIREKEKALNKHTVVVALSANAVNGAKEMFLKNGFDDFVAKPVQGKDFGECLKRWLNSSLLKENTAVDADVHIPQDFVQPDASKVNLNDAMERAGGFENWLAAAKTFAASINTKADDIEQFLAAKDYKSFTIAVHALKSSSKIVGADELSEKARNLEALGNRIQSLFENMDVLVDEIAVKTADLLPLYRSYTTVLSDVVHYGEKTDDEKNTVSEDELQGIIAQLKSAAEENSLSDAEEAFSKLKDTVVPPELKEKMDALGEAVENIDFDAILELLK